MSPERGALLVADPVARERDAIADLLRASGFFVADVPSGQQALELLAARSFDVLLAAEDLPDMPGLALLRAVSDRALPVPVLVVTPKPSLDTAVEAMRLGAVDYLSRMLSPEQVLARVEEALKKGRVIRAVTDAKQQAAQLAYSVGALEATLSGNYPPSSSRLRSSPPGEATQGLVVEELSRLSPRERDIARLLSQGNSVSDIAASLVLSPNTVRNHVKSIFSKLHVHSQVALVSKLAGHNR